MVPAGALSRCTGDGPRPWRHALRRALGVLLGLAVLATVAQAAEPQRQTLHSAILGEERPLLLELPRGYDESAESYPLIVLLDGEWRFRITSALLDSLADSGVMPPSILVGVVNTDRDRDLTPAFRGDDYGPGGAENFLRFIAEELLPHLESRYRTRPYRILVGHGHAGFFTLYTLMRRPALFSAYLVLSPSRGLDERHGRQLERRLAATPLRNRFVYLGYGGLDSDDIIDGSIAFGRNLERHGPLGLDVRVERFAADTHGSVVPKALISGFEHLGHWNTGFTSAGAPLLTPAQQRSAAVTARFGYDFLPAGAGAVSLARPLLALLDRGDRAALPAAWAYLQARPPAGRVDAPLELANLAAHLRAAGRDDDAEAVDRLRQQTGAAPVPPQALNNYGADVDLARGLVAHFPLDGDGADRSGHGHHGQVHGAEPVPDRHGTPLGALAFDGRQSRVEVADTPALDITGSLSISAWLKPDDLPAYAAWLARSLGGPSQWRAGLGAGGGRWGLTAHTNDWHDYLAAEGALPVGRWSHVVLCADQTLGEVRFYLNGRRVGRGGDLARFRSGHGPLLIGEQRDEPAHFRGAIDDLRLYARVLGEREIEALARP